MDLTDTKRAVSYSDFDITFAGDDSDQTSDKLDFDHPLAPLTLQLNTGGASLNNSVDVVLQVSFDGGSTWLDHSTLVSGGLDGSLNSQAYKPVDDGFAPVYRLKFSPTGTMSSETISNRVATPAEERQFH